MTHAPETGAINRRQKSELENRRRFMAPVSGACVLGFSRCFACWTVLKWRIKLQETRRPQVKSVQINDKLYGLFVPRTTRTLDCSYCGWTIRTSDYSYDGLFVPWTFCMMDCSYHRRFVQWTIRTMGDSYYGLFVPFVNYSHNINCWCEGVPPGCLIVYQMQVDLGVRLVICMLKLWHVGYFLVIIAKPTSCLLFSISVRAPSGSNSSFCTCFTY